MTSNTEESVPPPSAIKFISPAEPMYRALGPLPFMNSLRCRKASHVRSESPLTAGSWRAILSLVKWSKVI